MCVCASACHQGSLWDGWSASQRCNGSLPTGLSPQGLWMQREEVCPWVSLGLCAPRKESQRFGICDPPLPEAFLTEPRELGWRLLVRWRWFLDQSSPTTGSCGHYYHGPGASQQRAVSRRFLVRPLSPQRGDTCTCEHILIKMCAVHWHSNHPTNQTPSLLPPQACSRYPSARPGLLLDHITASTFFPPAPYLLGLVK